MKELVLHYCDRCGAFQQAWTNNPSGLYICAVCGEGQINPVPKEYTTLQMEMTIDKNKEQEFIKKYIKTSPNFDQYLFDHKDEIKGQQDRQYRAAMEHGKAVIEGRDKGNGYGVTCPYCKATNVRKIGIVSRSVSVGLFGLGSKKIGKQWHCDHCGSDF